MALLGHILYVWAPKGYHQRNITTIILAYSDYNQHILTSIARKILGLFTTKKLVGNQSFSMLTSSNYLFLKSNYLLLE